MKVVVLNGSPKGKNSITFQTVLFLQKKFPKDDFSVLHVGQRIRYYETHRSEVAEALEKADLLLFAYPVYTFIAPYQLHRFIELLKEEKLDLSGKYATQLTTSKHFYDVTAHKYIEENLRDLGLSYITGLSADMEDLLKKQGQKEAEQFWIYVRYSCRHGLCEIYPGEFAEQKELVYQRCLKEVEKKIPRDVVVVTNREKEDLTLQNMIEDFVAASPFSVRVINIKEYPFKGGCLGCFNCAVNGTCIYKDGFDEYLRTTIQTADAIVYAFTIKDHSMGASFKCYDDRQFCNGHRTVTIGMPIGYLINGRYSQEANLQMIINGRSQVGHNYLAGIATSEANPAVAIRSLTTKLAYALKQKILLPQNFYGVGGMKIFRDLIYLMRGMMKADHEFYKKHGFYDFPQKQIGTQVKMQLVGVLLGIPSLKKKMGSSINDAILGPYEKVIQEAQPRR